MIDQKTPHLLLPLPHPDNDGEDDVPRLRQAFSQIDAAVNTLNALVISDDVNLDTVREIVTVLKDAQGDIGDIAGILATKAGAAEVAQLATDLAAAQASLASAVDGLGGKASLGENTFTGSQNGARGASIASAASIDLNNADGNLVHVTGNDDISTVLLADGAERTVVFDAAPMLIHGAGLRCPGDADLRMKPGQTIKLIGDAGGLVRVVTGGSAVGLTKAKQYFYMQS